LFFGGNSYSGLDNFGAQLVKRVAEIVPHCVHDRAVVLRCSWSLRVSRSCNVAPGDVAAQKEWEPFKGSWKQQKEPQEELRSKDLDCL
jgi:hypothetical protein